MQYIFVMSSRSMGKMIESRCHRLVNGFISFRILDFCGYLILASITSFVVDKLEKRRRLLYGASFLRILLPYFLDKLCPEYIYRILSCIYVFTCKHVLTSIPSVGFSILSTGSSINIVSSISALARLLTIVDLLVCFFVSIFLRLIEKILENLSFVPRALLLQFLLLYLVDKPCPRYVNLIFSCVYVSPCISILLKSIPKIRFFLVNRSRGKIVFGVPASAFLFIRSSFFQILHFFNNCCLKYLTFFGTLMPHSNINSCPVETPEDEIDIKDIKLTVDDIRIVIQKLYHCGKNEQGDIDDNMLNYEELSALFEDSEPGLDEIHEAFFIFDQDRDGFFDARDLQIVLINLGLGENTTLNECKYMIEQHVSGCDGKISSSDFCRILEISFM